MVGAAGFEPATPRPPGRRERHEPTQPGEKRRDERTEVHEPTQLPGGSAGVGSTVDVVEAALADALRRAADAGAFDAVAALTAELRARREVRAAVVNLGAERQRRHGKG